MEEVKETIAVFTGDSENFHIFQVVDDELVGSIYIKKDKNLGIPEELVDQFNHSWQRCRTLEEESDSTARPGKRWK